MTITVARVVSIVIVTALTIVGCGHTDPSGDGTAADASIGRACSEPKESWTDLTKEFWSRDDTPHVPWTDKTGCLVHLDWVFHRWAAEECGWERVEVISIGLPIGTPYTGPDAQPPGQDWVPAFVHNTGGDFERLAPGVTLSTPERPASAFDTGLRHDGRELWMEADESLLYLTDGDETMVFVPDPTDDVGTCA